MTPCRLEPFKTSRVNSTNIPTVLIAGGTDWFVSYPFHADLRAKNGKPGRNE